MKRIALMVIKLIWIAPYWFFQIWSWGKNDRHTEAEKFALLKKKKKNANRAGRVTIDAHGIENLPEKMGYVMFPNHQGMFDVLSLLECCPHPFTVVMKKEVSNIFFVKQIRILMKAQAIDREDIRASVAVIRHMTKEVLEGRNYVIFAEGTRSRQQNQVQEFKGGTFKSAINAKCPIVPVALIDSYKPFDTRSIEKVTVQVHFLPPLYYEEYKGMKSLEIAAEVQRRIQVTIRQNENKSGAGASAANVRKK